jgi:hypothetical protein
VREEIGPLFTHETPTISVKLQKNPDAKVRKADEKRAKKDRTM